MSRQPPKSEAITEIDKIPESGFLVALPPLASAPRLAAAGSGSEGAWRSPVGRGDGESPSRRIRIDKAERLFTIG